MSMLLRRHYEAAEVAEDVIVGVPEQDQFSSEPPNGNASKADWHAYALAQGYPEEGLDGRTRDELRDLFND
jgi:hypothetical protein